jgi:hypothetical protein
MTPEKLWEHGSITLPVLHCEYILTANGSRTMPLNSLSSSGFATALAGINVDANAVTSVDFRINRALAVKLYVITIIFGMCKNFFFVFSLAPTSDTQMVPPRAD